MPIKDYYKILGVDKNASDSEIKKNFRDLAKKYHPDANPGDKTAEERFKEISEAHEVLANKEKRAKYDQLRNAQESGFDFSSFRQGAPKSYPGGAEYDLYNIFTDLFGDDKRKQKSSGFEDIFDMFFQGTGRNNPRQQSARKTSERGEDLNARIEIPFALAYSGGETIIKVPRYRDCGACRGTGVEPGAKVIQCSMCGGKGVMDFAQGGFAVQRTCPQCGGRGSQPTFKCKVCGGAGEVTETKQVRVKIPAGVKDGDKIRIKNEGNMHSWNKKRGDLYVVLNVKESEMYERKGDDIYYTAHINIAQAVLGSKIPVPTPEGEIMIKVPGGTKDGTVLKVSGRGAASIKSGVKGNFMVRIKVDIKPPADEKERKMTEEFAKKMGMEY